MLNHAQNKAAMGQTWLTFEIDFVHNTNQYP